MTSESVSLSCEGNSTGWIVKRNTTYGLSKCPYPRVSEIESTSDVILESPVHPVTEGDHVTLRCKHQNPSLVSKVNFYKDGGLIQNGTSREMTIPAVSKSHEGLYRCGYSDGEESPESLLLVRVVPSFLQCRLLFGLLVASPYMLATILLVMIHRQRQAKSPADDQPDYDDVGEDPEISPPPVAGPSSAP
ncbi:cell adhesion molecule CEACAM20-like [Aplochiton taeniatus]